MIRVEAPVTKTCPAMPAQWEAKTNDGRSVYVRYRYGRLRIDINGEPEFWVTHGTSWSGEMSFEELKQLTAGKFSWPESDVSE